MAHGDAIVVIVITAVRGVPDGRNWTRPKAANCPVSAGAVFTLTG